MVSSNTNRVVILFLFEFQYELYCPFILTFLMCLHSPEIAMKRISLIFLFKEKFKYQERWLGKENNPKHAHKLKVMIASHAIKRTNWIVYHLWIKRIDFRYILKYVWIYRYICKQIDFERKLDKSYIKDIQIIVRIMKWFAYWLLDHM